MFRGRCSRVPGPARPREGCSRASLPPAPPRLRHEPADLPARRRLRLGGRESGAFAGAESGFRRSVRGRPAWQEVANNASGQECSMRQIATMSVLTALLVGLPLAEALAGEGCCRPGRRAYLYAPPANPWQAWRAYYGAQAEVSFARRTGRARYYAATGRALPSRYFGPPTNAYAEYYALNPYSYFNCPMARRGEGICPEPDFFKP